MSGELVLIRHAETDFSGRFCGHSDPPLNERGIEQLALLQERMSNWKFDTLYSSDLQRAMQTAEAIVSEGSSSIKLRPGLREIFFGQWEGLTWNEIESRGHEEAQRWISEYPNQCVPGGEGYLSFAERVKKEADFLFKQAKKTRVAVVTHAGVIRTMLSLRCDTSDQQGWMWTQEYASVVVVSNQGRVLYTSAAVTHA